MISTSVERRNIRMIIKVFSTIIVLIYTVNPTSGVGEIGDLASGSVKVAIDSTQQIAESLKGLIENFSDFKKKFNKTYKSKDEEWQREQIFKVNLGSIFDHNDLFKKGKESYSLGMNSYGDLTHDEYIKILGVKLSKAHLNNGALSSSKNVHRHSRDVGCQFPVEKDWRKDGCVTPVKHQLQCGSCWAFASTSALESHYCLKYGKLPNFSEQQLVDCAAEEGKGCDGAFTYAAYEYVMKNGIATSDAYPYTGGELGAQNQCNKLSSNVKINSFQPIDQNEAAVKDAVCRFGPVACVIDAASLKFQYYHGGIYRNPACSTNPDHGNHAMLIVGYGTDSMTNEPYWLVKNSYGASWGENGYIRILRDPKHSCGIEKLTSYPIF